MDFDLTADQKLFRATTREFLEKEMPLTRVRELASSGIGFESDWWRRGSELGWNAMTVDPAAGGDSISGEGLVDTCIVAEEMGRLVSPGPLAPTNVVAEALGRRGTAEQRSRYLPGLIDGTTVAAWCLGTDAAGFDPGGEVTATRSGPGFVLEGVTGPVEAAGQADIAIGPPPEDWEGPVRHIGTEEFVIITQPGDPAAQGQTGRVHLSDLASRQWVHYTPESGLAHFLDEACAAAGFRPRIAVRTELGMSAANYAAAGLGPALVPAEIIPPHFPGLLLLPEPPVRRPLTAYTRTGPDPIAAAFIDILASEAPITPAHIRRRLGLHRTA